MPHTSRLLPALCCLAASAALPCFAQPRVRFDAAQIVPCHDVTSEESLATHSGERLWEAKLEVSSLIEGDERDLVHYFHRVDLLGEQVRFVDYLPRTTLGTEYAGNIELEDKDEKHNTLGVAVTGSVELLKVTPTAGVNRKRQSSIRYSLLPPKEQVSAAGTQRRGRGVYFKLKPSSQVTLEGGKEFQLIFRAPDSWRGGLALLRCDAVGVRRGLWRSLDEQRSTGRGLFVLAMYPAGDTAARAAAVEYAEAEAQLRRDAARHRRQIAEEARTDAGAWQWSRPATPRVPSSWLEQLLVQPSRAPLASFTRHLPSDVRRSAEEFQAAKRSLATLP